MYNVLTFLAITITWSINMTTAKRTENAVGRYQPCTKKICATSHLGCYHDHNFARVLDGPNLTSPVMTRKLCFEYCWKVGSDSKASINDRRKYHYAGVEFGKQCFCGTIAPPTNETTNASDCSKPCIGNSSETCGGTSRIDVFRLLNCTTTPIQLPYCNSSLKMTQRISDLLQRMTIDEKIACIDSKTCSLERFGVAQTWKESLHGLRYNCVRDVTTASEPICPTSFPHAQLLAANFNRSLWEAVGSAISTEARGFYNLFASGQSELTRHALSFWAPDLNLFRDPRWGRGLEVPGECPFLTGEYGMQYIRAMQVKDKRGFSKTLCNAKHFSAYDVEHGVTNEGHGEEYNRGSFNAIISAQDLVETYFPHFRTVVQGANLRGFMCSYNAVNGIPSCANGLFNNQVLRNKFGFTGMIVSDCSAVRGIIQSHHYTHTNDTTCAAALRGGTDLNCGKFYQTHVATALSDGVVHISDINTAVTRTLSQMFEVGLVEIDQPWADIGVSDIDSPLHRQLSFEGARGGFVLLKNDGELLPLKPTLGNDKVRVAILGPHFNSSTHLLANYYGENLLVFNHTPLFGMLHRKDVEVVGAAQGCTLSTNDTSGFAAAKKAAKKADVAIVYIGLESTQGPQNNTPAMEREGHDRTLITMPGIQTQFVQEIVSTGTPVVAILINSGGLAAEWIYKNVPAVLEAFYPGELGGDAIASILLGDVSPAGRLPNTIYSADFTAMRNITDMMMRPHTNPDGHLVPGITYRYYNKRPLFNFGYGMTYTTFNFSMLSPNKHTTTNSLLQAWPDYYKPSGITTLPKFNVRIENTGSVTSDIVILGFVSSNHSDAPLRELFGFERVTLKPRTSLTLSMVVPPQVLTLVDKDGTESIQAGKFSVSIGGEPDGFTHGLLAVSGAPKVVFTMPK